MKTFSFSLRSFFSKLLGGFLLTIVFLVTVNIITNSYLQSKMHEETVKYNESEIVNVVEEFERLWEDISYDMKLSYFKDESVLDLYYDDEFNVPASWNISNKIRASLTTNEYDYLDNLLIVMNSPSIVVHMDGTSDLQAMFTERFISEYPLSFWQDQFDQRYRQLVLPAVDFPQEIDAIRSKTKNFMPMIIRNNYYPEMFLVLLMDIEKISEEFRHPLSTDFYMISSESGLLYSMSGNEPLFKFSNNPDGHEVIDDYYYFYKRGEFSGITYINKVEAGLITSEKTRLNGLIWGAVLIALILSVAISWMVSVRLYSPVKRTMKLFQDFKRSGATEDGKGEFNFIHGHITNLISQNQSISEDLKNKASLLKSYAYSVRLKDIYTDSEHFKDVKLDEKPYYRLVLFNVTFHKSFHDELGLDEKKGVYYYRELVDQYMSQVFNAAATFQIENREIISMIFFEDPNEQIENEITGLMDIIKRDLDYCYLTIVIGNIQDSKTIMTEAYENIQGLVQQRELGWSHQILYEGQAIDSIQINQKQKSELQVYLEAKNFEMIHDWVDKIFTRMVKKSAPRQNFVELCSIVCDDIADHVLKNYKLDMGERDTEALRQYGVLEEFLEYVNQWIDQAALLAEQTNEENERDYIIEFVIDYLIKYYAEDISLEKIAEKRNMSSSYLSVYFKSKTGKNFSDYLNELRINAAKEMLLEPGITIQTVGEKVGYPSSNSFYRMFKKQTGFTPGEYRKKYSK